MKKYIMLSLFVSTVALQSCTQDYSCLCVATFAGQEDSDTKIIQASSESEAIKACDEGDIEGTLECEIE